MSETTERKLSAEDRDARVPDQHGPYKSTLTRGPSLAPVAVAQTPTELAAVPDNLIDSLGGITADLTTQHDGVPIGQRIRVSGRVLNDAGLPVPGAVIEIWQANAAGRYPHAGDAWDAPLDPNFTGMGRLVTDADGHYSFLTLRPGAYPWGNHDNAWRPAHIHFAVFGETFGARLMTQMYFPDDPLVALDPILDAVPAAARGRLIAHFDMDTTTAAFALGYTFDLVLRGVTGTQPGSHAQTPAQTIGPFFHYAMPWHGGADLVSGSSAGARPDLLPDGHDLLGTADDPIEAGDDIIEVTGQVLDGNGDVVPDALLEIWQADPEGHLPGEQPVGANRPFRGFGRCATDAEGQFRFVTLRPAPTPGPDGTPQAPHIAVVVFARGVLNRLATRIYFAGDPLNDSDAVLAAVPADRRNTLIANGAGRSWHWEIRLQGDHETVFLQC